MDIIIADTDELKSISYEIRKKVFIEEQKVPEELELENEEFSTSFLIKSSENEYVGTMRYRLIDDNTCKFERLAVLKEHRNKKYGYKLVKYLIDYILKNSDYKIMLNAQKYLINFYKKLGFKEIGEIFLEANIEHKKMIYE